MKFDELTQFPCLVPPAGVVCPSGGSNTGVGGGTTQPPGGDPRCADPVFRAANPTICPTDDVRCDDPAFVEAHPELCPTRARLVLKPDYVLKEVGETVKYRAFLLANGRETELLSGVVFRSSDVQKVSVGGASGMASALSVGPQTGSPPFSATVTISAEYQGLSADAKFDVIEDCADYSTTFLLLIDNSKSMKQIFSTLYNSRFIFSKVLARSFIDSIDFNRDRMAVMSFNGGATLVQASSQDRQTLRDAVSSLATTDNTTNIGQALQAGSDYLTGLGILQSKLVIVLFSDGENRIGPEPLGIARQFKDAGGTIMTVGLRAYDGGFTLLQQTATDGFGLNALPDNETLVDDWLSGLKSYLCSGYCTPAGNQTVPLAALNFTNFVKWDVISGKVDLCGDMGRPLYDFLPGNGLYPDLCGSPGLGDIRTKDYFPLVIGEEYKLSLYVAGNQREQRTPDVVRVRVWNPATAAIYLNQAITITDWTQGFTLYEFPFTASATDSVKVEIYQESIAAGGWNAVGNFIDVVTFRNTTTATILFADDFDSDNPTYFPPNCGNALDNPAYLATYGYCAASGCLTDPIPAQVPDPSPLTEVEP